MNYNFDTVTNRVGTNCIKYDLIAKYGYPPDTIPLWVADMDFPAPPEVITRLAEVAAHGIFGYTEADDSYFNIVQNWFSSRLRYCPQPQWLSVMPGVVFAIATAIRALTAEGDGVLIQRPVYYPFERMIKLNNRKLVNSPLLYNNGRYEINFADFEAKIVTENVKMFILCSPHNPVGRVWSTDELSRLGELCVRYGVTVVADEIHCDFIYPGGKFISYGTMSEKFLQNCVICTAPSKTFNLAGLQLANIFIPNPELHKHFNAETDRVGHSGINTCGLAACKAAYEFGAPWLDALIVYLQDNLALVRETLASRLPGVKLVEPEGTYLVWLDFTGLGLDDSVIIDTLKYKARLWLDRGTMFGPEGQGYQRVNIACPRAVLSQALDRLCLAFN
jgi:Bifunctional PLP-dependent enzyme with beta-cystathionase and maltose regulon repressor activities